MSRVKENPFSLPIQGRAGWLGGAHTERLDDLGATTLALMGELRIRFFWHAGFRATI